MAMLTQSSGAIVSVLLLLSLLGRLTFSARDDTMPSYCGAVQRFLEEHDLSNSPATPIPGYNLKVCNSSRSCCNAEAEAKYLQLTKEHLHSELERLTSRTGFLVWMNKFQFQGIFRDILSDAKNDTMRMMELSFPNISALMEPAARRFFLEMKGFIEGEEVELEASIRSFYDTLFAYTYEVYVNAAPAVEDSERVECLRENWVDFDEHSSNNGNTPYRQFQRALRTSLSVAKTLVQALELGADVISTATKFEFRSRCKNAFTRMLYCSHCTAALVYEKPCYNYCYNVISGCLDSLMELDPFWSRYIDKLDWFRSKIQGNANIQTVLLELPDEIKNAVISIRNMKEDDKVWVASRCNSYSGANNQRRQSPRQEKHQRYPRQLSRIHPGGQKISFSSDQKISLSSDPTGGPRQQLNLLAKLSYYTERLNATRSLFRELPLKWCDPKWAWAPTGAMDNHNCWNGESHGSYAKEAVSRDISTQRNINPEIKVPAHIDSSVSVLIDRLQHNYQLIEGIIEVIRTFNGCQYYNDDDLDCLDQSSGEGSQPQGLNTDDPDFLFKDITPTSSSVEIKHCKVNSGSRGGQLNSYPDLQLMLILSTILYAATVY